MGSVRRGFRSYGNGAFRIVCGGGNLSNGTISYHIWLAKTNLNSSKNGASYSLYTDATHYNVLGSTPIGEDTIKGTFTVHNHHGATSWLPIYVSLKVDENSPPQQVDRTITFNYSLELNSNLHS